MKRLWRLIRNPWIGGLIVSVGSGHFATNAFVKWLNRYLGFQEQWINENIHSNLRDIPPYLTGILERFFFTILVAFDVSAVSAGIMTWVLIKMATNWNRINPTRGRDYRNVSDDSITTLEQAQQQQIPRQVAKLRIYAVKSLLGVLFSMLFAVIGGLICRGQIWINFIPQALGD